jgi:ribosomal protein S18 acetylase RimI-like enzyme
VELRPTGPAYLELVTDLLQRVRLADPVAGLWEAADLQWWYTRDPEPTAVFWTDAGGVPTTAAVFTRWSPDRYGCDVLGDTSYEPAWDFVREHSASLAGASIEMEVAPDFAAAAARVGFTPTADAYEVTWMDAAARPDPRPFPPVYSLEDRSASSDPHPMIRRNGLSVEARLHDCPLYDPGCDLAIRAPDGTVAGYALFWPDLRTGVGLIEPVRVEDSHAGRGLAGTMLRAGLARLADRGCTRFKISHDVNNPASRAAYHHAGFTTQAQIPNYRRA